MGQFQFAPWQIEQIQREISIVAVRSRGPGGQNVNKVSSAAVAYWNPHVSSALLQDQRATITQKLASEINRDGYLISRSDEFRDFPQNKSRAIEKLISTLATALYKPKKRYATKPTRASKERHLKSKSKRGDIKKMRQKVSKDYD